LDKVLAYRRGLEAGGTAGKRRSKNRREEHVYSEGKDLSGEGWFDDGKDEWTSESVGP